MANIAHAINNSKNIKIDQHLLLSSNPDFYQFTNSLLTLSPDSITPGTGFVFSSELIRFRSNARLAFPAVDIDSCEINSSKTSNMPFVTITVNFLGLYGVSSPLPTHYSEEILYQGEQDSIIRHFLDMFNHRFISYLYRINDKYKYSISPINNTPDGLSSNLLALLGFSEIDVNNGFGLDWKRLIPMVGLHGVAAGSASLLKKLISHYFRIPSVSIKQNIIQKIPVCDSQINSLGVKNSKLGQDFSIGSNVYDCAGKFRVVIHKLTLAEYKRFFPGGKYNKELKVLIGLVVTSVLKYDIELNVEENEISNCVISKKDPEQLGVSCWLGNCNDKYQKLIVDS